MKKITALLLASLLLLPSLWGCKKEIELPEPVIPVVNDGGQAKVVLGEVYQSDERTAVLREIADKYEADWKNTEIEIKTYQTEEELTAALRNGEVSAAEVFSHDQTQLVKEGLLMKLPLERWEESPKLVPAAQAAAYSMGQESCYIFPYEVKQTIMYYRSDVYEEYNSSTEGEEVHFQTWNQLLRANELLGEKGKFVFAGKERLIDFFDTMVWTYVGSRAITDNAAGYFSQRENSTVTVFSKEKAANGAEMFAKIMNEFALEGSLDYDYDEAVDAFVNGRAFCLISDRDASKTLSEKMPEGTWTAAAFPRGGGGTVVFPYESFAGWGISSKCEDWEKTFHFLGYLSGADCNTHYAAVLGTLPMHAEAGTMELSLASSPVGAELWMLPYGSRFKYASEPVMYEAYNGYREFADNEVRRALNGEITNKELLAELNGYWQQAYKDEGKLF